MAKGKSKPKATRRKSTGPVRRTPRAFMTIPEHVLDVLDILAEEDARATGGKANRSATTSSLILAEKKRRDEKKASDA